MKLSSIFKKQKNTKLKSTTQTLDKKQLEKVIGGGDGTITTTMETTASKAKIIMDRDSG